MAFLCFFLRVKLFRLKKIKKFKIALITSFTLLLSKKLFLPIEKLTSYFNNSKQLKKPLWENLSDLQDTMQRQRSLCFFIVTMLLTGHHIMSVVIYWFLRWVLRIWESAFYYQAFFTLQYFLPVSRPPWGRQFNLDISRALCWYFRNKAPVQLFVWITKIHNKIFQVTSIYVLQLCSYEL